ncbi:MAG: DMT family transporter [Candidatus Promineifilaceae bacterium]|nr:DMT family transporter [Candidatus Promineifilaceae bacterium]
MSPLHLLELLVLSGIWGASFLFMRIAAPVMGPVWLIEFRVLVAGLVLLPVLARRGKLGQLRRFWKPLLILGIINSAVPFTLLAFASVFLPAGLTSILNATAPLFGVVVAFFWLHERLSLARVIGFLLGFAGVVILVGWENGVGAELPLAAVVAALTAALMYAVAAPYARLRLGAAVPLTTATGSQLGAALFLLPAVPFATPRQALSLYVLLVALALAVLSTAVAYILYFRLINSIGSSKALTVTYLVPLFAMVWAFVVLAEPITPAMLTGCAFILLGTAVANELFTRANR